MQIRVLVSSLLPKKEGVSQNGKQYVIQDFIGRTFDQYPKDVCFSIFNPDQYKPVPQPGNDISIDFDLDSRCYKGRDGAERWSTTVRVNSIISYVDPQQQQQLTSGQQPQPSLSQYQAGVPTPPSAPQYVSQSPSQQYAPQPAQQSSDDLPF